jgi:peptidoglycan/xylan/chitin deacetylase (PgdA/CDA1 family)
LTETRTIVTIDDLTAWLVTGEPLPDRPAVVTFDDGYKDFITDALPILKKYEVPSTVYISTGLSNESPSTPFEQQLANVLTSSNSVSVSHEKVSIRSEMMSMEDVIDVYDELRQAVKHSSPEVRKRLLDELGAQIEQPSPVLDREDLASLSTEPLVTIGSHGHDHVPFTSLSTDEKNENVRQSKKWLADILGSQPDHFSFPYGSFDRPAVKTVRKAGFRSAVTTRSRVVSPIDWNSRFNASSSSFEVIL